MNSTTQTPLIRRFVVLSVLFLLMLGAKALGTPEIGTTPLILAAIGFVILTSFSVAETASVLSLPRVTGYIVTGAVLRYSGTLSSAVVDELRMFNTLALGLIALGAGLELSLPALARLSRTLLATTAAKICLTGPLAALVAYLYVTYAPLLSLPTPELPDFNAIIAFSLVIGALSIGTSPSIALAVISESKSKGRVSDLVMGAAVLKDIVVIILLAIAIAVSAGLFTGEQLDASVLSHVGKELVFSLAAGLILGILLIGYIRYIKAEMLLFVGAMILTVSELSSWLHLELLLVFIVGGFVVRNFSRYEHDLSRPVQLVSLPIFVVFFTIAGANIDLGATVLFLPMALILATMRALSFATAAFIGNRVGGEADNVRKNVWLGYLPQAGVTLGLLGLACEKLPQISTALKSGGLAFVAVNLLVGPIALRFALRRAGDIASSVDEELVSDQNAVAEELPASIAEPLDATIARLIAEVLTPASLSHERWGATLIHQFTNLSSALKTSPMVAESEWVKLKAWLFELDAEASQQLYVEGRLVIRFLPTVVSAPQTDTALKRQESDSLSIRAQKRLRHLARRLTFRKPPRRRVPLLDLARECFEPRLAELSNQLWASKLRLCATVLEDLTTLERLDATSFEIEGLINNRMADWLENSRQELNHVCSRAALELTPLALAADTPYQAQQKFSAKTVDDRVRAAFARSGTQRSWLEALDADFSRLTTVRRLGVIERELKSRVHAHTTATIYLSLEKLRVSLSAWQAEVEDITTSEGTDQYVQGCSTHDASLGELPRALIESTTADLRQALDLRPLSFWLTQEIEALPETVILTTSEPSPSRALQPADLSYQTLQLRSTTDSVLLKTSMTAFEARAQSFDLTFRGICNKLLHAQDDFRTAYRSMELDPRKRPELAPKIVTTLLTAYRSCSQSLDEKLLTLQSTAQDVVQDATNALNSSVMLEGSLGATQSRPAYLLALMRSLALRPKRLVLHLRQKGRTWWHKTGDRLFGGIAREFLARSADRALDTQNLSEAVRALDATVDQDYAKYFVLTPVRDPTLFIHNRRLLAELVVMEKSWLKGGISSTLVVGEHGSGKTSLLNMLHYRATAPRVIRLEPVEWRRQVGVIRTLAYSLDCNPKLADLEIAATEQPTHILIDDLEQWIRPGVLGIQDVLQIVELIGRTQKRAFWTVTVDASFFDVVSEAIELSSSFGTVAKIQPLTRDEVRKVIEIRHSASGKELELPRALSSWLKWEALSPGDQEVVFELLRRTSAGNISRVLVLWSLLTKVDEDGCVRIHASSAPLAVSLPFLRKFTGPQLAVVSLLNRLGPLSSYELSTELQLGTEELSRILNFFEAAGLLQRLDTGHLFCLSPRCRALAASGLKGLLAA